MPSARFNGKSLNAEYTEVPIEALPQSSAEETFLGFGSWIINTKAFITESTERALKPIPQRTTEKAQILSPDFSRREKDFFEIGC